MKNDKIWQKIVTRRDLKLRHHTLHSFNFLAKCFSVLIKLIFTGSELKNFTS